MIGERSLFLAQMQGRCGMNTNEVSQATANRSARIGQAQQLFREFYALCFWHMKPDLVITEATVPLIIKGLRTHGGRRGMLAAATLEG